MMWYRSAGKDYFETLPIGNGRIGALVFGDVVSEKITLNEDTLWSGYYKDTINYEAYNNLEKVRNLIFEGENLEAQSIIEEKMLSCWSQSYMPLGELLLNFENDSDYVDYKRELKLEEGTVNITYKIDDVIYERKIFISYPDDVMVINLSCNKKRMLNFSMTMDSKIKHTIKCIDRNVIMSGKCPTHVEPNYIVDAKEPIVYEDNGEGLEFLAFASIIPNGDADILLNEGKLIVKNADNCTIIFSSANNYKSEKYYIECEDKVNKASAKSFKELLDNHIEDFKSIFNRVNFKLGEHPNLPTDERIKNFIQGKKDNALISLFFQYGRYLLISSSRQGVPANLQGIWSWEMRPAWSANWTININTQMNYWLSEVCNLPECSKVLIEWINSLIPSGEKTARIHYNCRGYCMHHNVDNWGITTPVSDNAQWAFWPMAGVWLCQHVFDHYLYSLDKDYLKKVALPIIKGSVLFCLDWLVEDEKGFFVTNPSISPENPFFDINGNRANVTYGSCIDMSLIREIFSNYLNLCNILHIKDDIYTEIEEKYEKLLPYLITKDGRLCEWSYDYIEAEPGHRHLSNLYGIYPSNILDNDIIRKAAKKSFEKRLEDGGAQVGWSMAWTVALAARFKDKEIATRFVKKIIKEVISPNLFNIYFAQNVKNTGNDSHTNAVNYSPKGWFQIDGNLGGTAAIAELLLQSHEGYIDLLPCLPNDWDNGVIEGLRARGDIEVNMSWENGELLWANIKTGDRFNEEEPLMIRYNDNIKEIKCKKNQTIKLISVLNIEGGFNYDIA